MTKSIFPILINTIILFLFISCSVRLQTIKFNPNVSVEDKSDTRNYILKKDGTKIYGEKVSIDFHLLRKHIIMIDNQSVKLSETRGYRMKNVFYGYAGVNSFFQRIAHGRLNMYFDEGRLITTNQQGLQTGNQPYYNLYFQKGETDKITFVKSRTKLKELISDCPEAFKLLNITPQELSNRINANPDYMNKAFDIYNNDCK